MEQAPRCLLIKGHKVIISKEGIKENSSGEPQKVIFRTVKAIAKASSMHALFFLLIYFHFEAEWIARTKIGWEWFPFENKEQKRTCQISTIFVTPRFMNKMRTPPRWGQLKETEWACYLTRTFLLTELSTVKNLSREFLYWNRQQIKHITNLRVPRNIKTRDIFSLFSYLGVVSVCSH